MYRYYKSINIYYCGREKCDVGHFFGPAVRSHYLMHFVLSGRGVYQCRGQSYEVEKGEAFLIRPQEITYYEADEKDPWEYAWVAFNGIEAEGMLQAAGMSENKLVCKIINLKESTEFLEKMIQTFQESGHHEYEMVGFFFLLFSTIKKEEPKIKNKPDREYLDQALAYIQNNYSYDIHVTDIASFVGIDRTYLFKIFKEYKNLSPKKYLLQYRILAAKDMITNTNYSMTEVALSCGFYDLPSFCRNFKSQEGCTPTEYRKLL